jgi:uncharacterized protein YndB with AHSA1/START domain
MRLLTLIATLCVLTACAAARSDGGSILTVGRVEAPVAQVWEAWATTPGLKSWLAPHVEIDLRVGGLMRTHYSATGVLGDPGTIENQILSFDPERMLSLRVAKAPQGFPFPNAVRDMWTIVYFAPQADGATEVRIVGHGFGASDEARRMREFFDKGNAVTLAMLQKRFANKPAGQ